MASQINYGHLVICLIVSIALVDSNVGHLYGEKKSIMGGGRKPISTNNPQVQSLSQWAAKQLGGTCIAVIKAQEQVVSGLLYYIDFKMKSSGKSYSCRIKVWLQPWKHRTELVQHRCIRQYSTDELTWDL